MGVNRLKKWLFSALIIILFWPAILSAFFNNLGAIYLVKSRLNSPLLISLSESVLLQAAQMDRTNSGAQHNLGLVYTFQSSWIEADAAFVQGIESAPENPLLHYRLGQARKQQMRTEDARREFTLAGAWKDLREDYSVEGLERLEAKDFPRAGESFRKMIASAEAMQDDYWMSQGYQWLGWTLERQGLPDQAIDAFETAIAIGQDLGPARGARMDLARIYSGSGKFYLSTTLIEEANRFEPANRRLLLMAGDLYRENGDCRLAIDYYRQATRVPPFEGLDWHGLATCYLQLGQPAEAAAAAKAGLEQNNHLPFLHLDLAKAYLRMGELNQACSEVKATTDLSPDDPGLAQIEAEIPCISGP